MKLCIAIALAVFLTGCGSKIKGDYADSNGMVEYKFQSGDKVYLKAMGMETEGKYEVDGNKVKVENNGQNLIFTINDDGSLQSPFGKLKKKD